MLIGKPVADAAMIDLGILTSAIRIDPKVPFWRNLDLVALGLAAVT
jgi:hypothetical protein